MGSLRTSMQNAACTSMLPSSLPASALPDAGAAGTWPSLRASSR